MPFTVACKHDMFKNKKRVNIISYHMWISLVDVKQHLELHGGMN